MRRAFLTFAVAVTLAVVGFGCNAILGNDQHTLDACPPGATKCSDTGADVLECSDGNAWTKKTTCPDACTDGACTECAAGTKGCDGQTPRTCNASGQWVDGTACKNACADAACVGECAPGAKQCVGDKLQACDAMGKWQDEKTCPSACEMGACTQCAVNDTRCMGATIQICDENGNWRASTTCPYVCSDGTCSGMCVPNSTQCNGDTPETCDDSGTWQDGNSCPKVCSAGMCVGMCVPGTTQCSNLTPETCDASGQFVDGTPCQFVCQNGACTGVCTPNDVQCMGNVPQVCDATGQWQSGMACPFLCTAGACTGMCLPNTMQGCGSAATCNAGGMQTCDATGTWGPCNPMPNACTTTPNGWQPVALTSGACPSGFGMPQTYIESVMAAPYTCTCACSGTQVCRGTGTLNHYGNAGCTGNPTATDVLSFSTACGGGGSNIVNGDGCILSNVSFGPGPACGATGTATVKPMPTETTTYLCQPDLSCPGGACLTMAQQAGLCVAHSGMMACPSGYPNQTVVSLGIKDTRGCGSCACGSTLGCTFQSLLVDNDSACGASPYSFTAPPNTCVDANAPSNFPFNAAKANATITGTGTCNQTAPSSPTGTVALDPTQDVTVCCP